MFNFVVKYAVRMAAMIAFSALLTTFSVVVVIVRRRSFASDLETRSAVQGSIA